MRDGAGTRLAKRHDALSAPRPPQKAASASRRKKSAHASTSNGLQGPFHLILHRKVHHGARYHLQTNPTAAAPYAAASPWAVVRMFRISKQIKVLVRLDQRIHYQRYVVLQNVVVHRPMRQRQMAFRFFAKFSFAWLS